LCWEKRKLQEDIRKFKLIEKNYAGGAGGEGQERDQRVTFLNPPPVKLIQEAEKKGREDRRQREMASEGGKKRHNSLRGTRIGPKGKKKKKPTCKSGGVQPSKEHSHGRSKYEMKNKIYGTLLGESGNPWEKKIRTRLGKAGEKRKVSLACSRGPKHLAAKKGPPLESGGKRWKKENGEKRLFIIGGWFPKGKPKAKGREEV